MVHTPPSVSDDSPGGVLAIETATEACSIALIAEGIVAEHHEVVPRQHSQRLFQLLDALVPQADLRGAGVVAVAYGCGPGSFTGLRIAAAAAQGIAYACQLPAVPVSTLAVLAQTARQDGVVDDADLVLATLDARLNEMYAALYEFEDGLAVLRQGPWACAPEDLPVAGKAMQMVGSGARFIERCPTSVKRAVLAATAEVLPRARDMLPLAQRALRRGVVQQPDEVCPIYVRDDIGWKKLHEQGTVS